MSRGHYFATKEIDQALPVEGKKRRKPPSSESPERRKCSHPRGHRHPESLRPSSSSRSARNFSSPYVVVVAAGAAALGPKYVVPSFADCSPAAVHACCSTCGLYLVVARRDRSRPREGLLLPLLSPV